MQKPVTPQYAGAVGPDRPVGSRLQAYISVLDRLQKSQWLDGRALTEHQFRLLRPLAMHAFRTVPYYRRTFLAAGLKPRDLCAETWPMVPILTRSTLQDEDLLSRHVPKMHGRLFETQTSGSTGQPVKINSTGYAQFFFRALNIRDHLWHQRDMTAKHAAIRHFPERDIPPEGLVAGNWGLAVAALFGAGPSVTLSIRKSVDHQLRWLVEHDPAYLLTYPSNLAALIEHSRQTGRSLASLREVRTISETVTPALRRLCREAWGIPLTDVYSSQEIGIFALQCPASEQYHIQSESALVEILGEDDQPCRPGEIGRVVVTALHNYATPLIRYEIRDYAEVGGPCACGRGLPVIRRIVGRQRNMLVLPNGEKRWPVVDWGRYREVAPVRQFQFIQHSLDQIEMRLVCERELTMADRQKLVAIVQNALGHPFSILLTPMADIPQGANGKFEEFISLVSDQAPVGTLPVKRPHSGLDEVGHE